MSSREQKVCPRGTMLASEPTKHPQYLAPWDLPLLLKNKKHLTSQCFLHREVLMSKALGDKMKKSTICSYKKWLTLLNQNLFIQKCLKNYMKLWTKHIKLLLRAELQWLSRWTALKRCQSWKLNRRSNFTQCVRFCLVLGKWISIKTRQFSKHLSKEKTEQLSARS